MGKNNDSVNVSKSKFFSGMDASAVIDRNVDIIYFFSADCSNQQGDPLTNKPRRTPDGLGLMTKQGLSRKIRDTVQMRHGDEMMIVKGGVKSLAVRAAAATVGIDDRNLTGEQESDDESDEVSASEDTKKGKKKSTKKGEKGAFDRQRSEVAAALTKKFWDVRTFGGAITDPFNFSLTGPVAMSMAKSLSPVTLMLLKITSCAVANEAEKNAHKDSTFGDLPVVRFGAFRTHISVNPFLAARTGMTWGDLDKIVDALQFMWSLTKAANRSGMAFERMDIFVHEHAGGSVPSERINRAVRTAQISVDEPASFSDYEITVETIPGVSHSVITLVGDAVIQPIHPTTPTKADVAVA